MYNNWHPPCGIEAICSKCGIPEKETDPYRNYKTAQCEYHVYQSPTIGGPRYILKLSFLTSKEPINLALYMFGLIKNTSSFLGHNHGNGIDCM